MTEVDGAVKPTMPYQAAKTGSTTLAQTIVMICAALAVVLLLWYLLQVSQSDRTITRLTDESNQLDSNIAVANTWPTKTVEAQSASLQTIAKTYQQLLNGKTMWSNLIPLLSSNTLQGVTLSGMTINQKLEVKVDGATHATTSGSDVYSPYSMVARQVVAYRDAKFTPSAPTTATGQTATTTPAKANVFSDVTLTAISQKTLQQKDGTSQTEGTFSMSLTLNPLVLQSSIGAAK